MAKLMEPTPEILDTLRKSGSNDRAEAFQAQYEFSQALQEPLRQGVQSGDVTGGIFEVTTDGNTEFPLDLLAPGTEGQHVAYTNPGHGYIPHKSVEADYVRISTYGITSSIDFLLKNARNAHWNLVARALQVFEAGFVKKINDDAWHTLLAAAADRNILVYDADAAAGQLTKRLLSLIKSVMRRNGGGNSVTSRGRATDLYLSVEGIEDIRNWSIDQLDDTSRREVYKSADDGAPLTRIYGLNLHDMFEIGDGQEYQDYFITDLGGSLGSSDVELVIALDQAANDSFIMPVTQALEVFPDEALHRSQKQGYYGWAEMGFGVLDARRVLAASF